MKAAARALVLGLAAMSAAADGNYPPVWPAPASYISGESTVSVSMDLTFTGDIDNKDVSDAISRYQRWWLFPHLPSLGSKARTADADLTEVQVSIANASAELQLYVDESYQLEVPVSGAIQLTAATQVGFFRGLETLSQLIVFDFDADEYTIALAPWSIDDAPRFPHRQLMIDTSRHFESVHIIKQIMDSASFAKVNTIHWHIVDSQSFPFDAPSHPELAEFGAYSKVERYTDADVAQLVEYARKRGIRVMVEFDTPGHAASWCNGAPDICPSADCPEPLDPSKNATFDLLTDLFRDTSGGAPGLGLFPETLMHLGGDEVNTKCWTESESISAWMDEQGLDAEGAYLYFVQRVQQIAMDMGREVVGWDEIWDNFGTSLDPRTIIANWRNINSTDVTSKGYRMLYCPDPLWYLDSLTTNWTRRYLAEPCDGVAEENEDLVLGGGGQMWGETADASDVLFTIWPNQAAIAERLWSPRDVRNTTAAEPRLEAFRCILMDRGVPVTAVTNSLARSAPSGPGSCSAQRRR